MSPSSAALSCQLILPSGKNSFFSCPASAPTLMGLRRRCKIFDRSSCPSLTESAIHASYFFKHQIHNSLVNRIPKSVNNYKGI